MQLCILFVPFHPLCSYFVFPFLIFFIHDFFAPLLSGHTQAIDCFVTESLETLSTRPESLEEIGAASSKYSQILAQKPQVRLSHYKALIKNFSDPNLNRTQTLP